MYLFVGLYAVLVIVVIAFGFLYYLVYFQHAMFWLPILTPIWQITLLPMAAIFLSYPNTKWTTPSQFPTEFPENLYTWLVNKTIFLSGVIIAPLFFVGHPFNILTISGYYKFLGEDYEAITSDETAL